MPARHGPPRPLLLPKPRIPDGQPNPYFERHKDRLARLREEFAVGTCVDRNETAADKEWRSLPHRMRLFLLVFCGIDEPEDVLSRTWRELPDAERMVISAGIRELQQSFQPVFALTL